jgi:glutathionylspermidine synthase
MQRESLIPRPHWRERAEALGFHFHSIGGIYWDESACYRFTADQIDTLESATTELHRLCLNAVDAFIRQHRFEEFAIPPAFIPYVIESWNRHEFSLYGRFDLCYNGADPPKLLEYNADTPTALLEASVMQWDWLQEIRSTADQFNSLHEQLIRRWETLRNTLPLRPPPLHFACCRDHSEDRGNLDYLCDTALQAGLAVRSIDIEDIGWNTAERRFVDLDNAPIRILFKLYPWEWLVREAFGEHLLSGTLRLIEPPWKMLLSNKALLALLWELCPDHPNLLPCYFGAERLQGRACVRKPLYSREGANITLMAGETVLHEPGRYGAEGFVYQAYSPLPVFDDQHPVIGAWIVGDRPAGIGIREDRSPITTNASRFIPHYFE